MDGILFDFFPSKGVGIKAKVLERDYYGAKVTRKVDETSRLIT